MAEKLHKRHWQFWFALCGRGCTTWTSNPNLFEVLWVPALLTLNRRSFKRSKSLGEATVKMLWGYWCDQHLPWRLRAKVERLQEMNRKNFREKVNLRLELHMYKKLYEMKQQE